MREHPASHASPSMDAYDVRRTNSSTSAPTSTPTSTVSTVTAASIDLPSQVRVAVTIFYVIVYGLLFVGIAYQLALIFYHRYKKLAYRTVFVALCLAWALLRVIMFALYFDLNVCTVAYDLPVVAYWLLYALPVCLQFATLSLFAHYYIAVVNKGGRELRQREGGGDEPSRCCRMSSSSFNAIVWALLLAIFVAVNTTCCVLTYADYNSLRKKSMGVIRPGTVSPYVYPILRVGITEGLFLLVAVTISVCIVKIARSSGLKRTLESEGMSAVQSTAIVLVLLFLTRIAYNIVATKTTLGVNSKGYNWPIVADEADYGGDVGTGYIIFGVVLFVWEYLPTVAVIVHFRVKRPPAVQREDVIPPVSQSYFKKPSERRPLLSSGSRPL
ncbi:G protein-coupled receptor 137Ba-like isoform X2 [Oscarella lobularis]|uniref:G protein-coupled receptor 137Ba-like isoform X2 n=1 Tax=Oscarella lobularis TaxID=121494 RepID=UPI0033131907